MYLSTKFKFDKITIFYAVHWSIVVLLFQNIKIANIAQIFNFPFKTREIGRMITTKPCKIHVLCKYTLRKLQIHAFSKDQANSKQHPEVELLLFENYSHSSSTLLSKNNTTYSKK